MWDALRLGCVGIGYTILPGTADRRFLYEQLRELTREAKSVGLLVVVWGYARSADQHGVDIIQNCAATGFRIENGRIVGVETEKGFRITINGSYRKVGPQAEPEAT